MNESERKFIIEKFSKLRPNGLGDPEDETTDNEVNNLGNSVRTPTSPTRRPKYGLNEAVSSVLVIYCGGTIGMKKENGG